MSRPQETELVLAALGIDDEINTALAGQVIKRHGPQYSQNINSIRKDIFF